VQAESRAIELSEAERNVIDAAILNMAKSGKRRGAFCSSLVNLRSDKDACKQADELIAETLISIMRDVPDSAGEKLFERISRVLDSWSDIDQQRVLGTIFIRFMDTMLYMIAYKGKFRGINRNMSILKEDALAELRIRGLARK
jgi:hypothetical protein